MARTLPIPAFLIEQFRFLRRLAREPRTVGAIAPSSSALARAMAAQIPAGSKTVLELGPGTGVVTAAILARGIAPSNLTAVEFDPHFASLIRERYPGTRILEGDAFDLVSVLGSEGNFAAIVSSLPLLNFAPAKRHALMSDVFNRLAPGGPFIQFSYGWSPPVAAPKGGSVVRTAQILFNLPPARVWVYRKDRD